MPASTTTIRQQVPFPEETAKAIQIHEAVMQEHAEVFRAMAK